MLELKVKRISKVLPRNSNDFLLSHLLTLILL